MSASNFFAPAEGFPLCADLEMFLGGSSESSSLSSLDSSATAAFARTLPFAFFEDLSTDSSEDDSSVSSLELSALGGAGG